MLHTLTHLSLSDKMTLCIEEKIYFQTFSFTAVVLKDEKNLKVLRIRTY